MKNETLAWTQPHGKCRSVRLFRERNHPVLQVVENTRQISWLGVRDGIRNWLVTAA